MSEENIEDDTIKTSKRKWPKIVGISIGGVIGVVAIIVLLFPTIISSNFAKNRIENILGKSLNRKVEIGDLKMGWSSGLDIKNLIIKDRDAFPGPPFVKVNRIFCDINFFLLMKKQIKIKNFLIDSPEVILQRDKNGVFNYEDVDETAKVKPQSGKVITPAPETSPKPFDRKKLVPLAIPLLFDVELNAMVTNGKFTFIDHRSGEEIQINGFNSTLNIEAMDKPIEFKSTFNIEANGETEQADISLNISLAKDGRLDPRSARGVFNMETGFAQMTADFDMAKFMGKEGAGLDFSLNVDLGQLTHKLAGILGMPDGMRVEGYVNSGITANGQLGKQIDFYGNTVIMDLNISGGPLGNTPIKQQKITLLQSAVLDIANDKVTINKIVMQSNFLDMEITGMINGLRSEMDFDLRAIMNCDIAKLMTEMKGVLPEDLEVSGNMQLDIELQGTRNNFEMEGKTGLKELIVKKGAIGPIKEPEINIAFNTKYNLQDNKLLIKKLSVDSSILEIKSTGALNGNAEVNLNIIVLVADIQKLLDSLHGVVSIPPGLRVSGKLAEEVKVTGNIKEKVKLEGKAILLGVSATGGPLKKTRLTNLDLKLPHTLYYDIRKDFLNIEQLDINSDFMDMIFKGKISNLTKEMETDCGVSLNMDLDKVSVLFAEMLPANMFMKGKGVVGLGMNGKLASLNSENIFKNINFNGNISMDMIVYDSYKITDFKTGLSLDSGLFETKDFVFKINEGEGALSAKANFNEEKPPLEIVVKLSDMRINKDMDILAYIVPIFSSEGRITGMLDLDIKAHGAGLDWQEELSKTLEAQGEINIRNGSVEGGKILSTILSAVKRGEVYKFKNIIAEFKVDNGKIFTDDIKVNGKDFNIGLSGWTSFDGHLEYSVDVDILDKYVRGDVGKILGVLSKSGLKIPIVITGTTGDPKIAFKKPKSQDIKSFLQVLLGEKETPVKKAEETKAPVAEVYNKEEKTTGPPKETQPKETKKKDIVDKIFKFFR